MSDEKKKKSSIRTNTNISNLTELTGQNLKRVNSALETSLERLSTGLKINTGKQPTTEPVAEQVDRDPLRFSEVAYDAHGHIIVDVDASANRRPLDEFA
jgi:hypothetical protein